MYFNFSEFLLKVLELFECRLGNPYMTTNRNWFALLTRTDVGRHNLFYCN